MGFTLVSALRKVDTVSARRHHCETRALLCCGWRTLNQHGTVLFTWNQHPSCVSSMCPLPVSLPCGHDRAHMLWESQSSLSHCSPVWILIHRNGRGLQTVLTAVPREGVASSVHCGHGQTRSFVTIVALFSKVIFRFQLTSTCRAEKRWFEMILRKDLVPHPRTPVQNRIVKKSYFHIACITESMISEYKITMELPGLVFIWFISHRVVCTSKKLITGYFERNVHITYFWV